MNWRWIYKVIMGLGGYRWTKMKKKKASCNNYKSIPDKTVTDTLL